jgi:hypothetical protein
MRDRISTLMTELGLGPDDLADLIDSDVDTVAKYLEGMDMPGDWSTNLLAALDSSRVDDADGSVANNNILNIDDYVQGGKRGASYEDLATPLFDADALVQRAEVYFNVQDGAVGERRESTLNGLHALFVELIKSGATATVRDRVINNVIIKHYGKEYGGARAMNSTWNEIEKEILEAQKVEVQAQLGEPELTAQEKMTLREELWPSVEALANDENLLGAMVAKTHELGVVGEEQLVKLVYVVATSRMLSDPVNLVVKGTSSGGKSFVIEQTLRLTPDDEMYKLTTSSPLALVYDHRPLAHKIVMVYEATPLQQDENSTFALLLRTLISEGRISHLTTVEDADSPTGRRVETVVREGPISLIITTTAESLHAENETRLLSYRVTETVAQTKAIFSKLARNVEATGLEVDLGAWHDFQRWLQLGPTDVVIPFASRLAERTPGTMVRFRRDFGALLNFIRAVAVIHQAQRDTNDNGYIVATLLDYEVARGIFDQIMTQNSGQAPSENVRIIVEHVQGLILAQGHENGKAVASKPTGIVRHGARSPQLGITISSRRLGEMIGTGQKAALRAINSAIEQGYLINEETRRGKSFILSMGQRELDEAQAILPTAEELAATDMTTRGGDDA